MTEPFCMECTAALFSPEDMEYADRLVASAPPLTPEQRHFLKELFRSVPRPARESPPKPCGH